MRTVLVTGGARGIGRELVRQYASAGWSVVATVRDSAQGETLRGFGDIRTEILDMRERTALAGFAERLGDGPLDLFIANAGITTRDEDVRTAEEADAFLDVLAVNTVAPTLLAAALAPKVIAARGKMIAITSQMGSIADNGSGGWLAYRASKAALNQAWKTLAVEMAAEPIAIAMLHPGWVKTAMGGPGAPLQPEESVADMRRVIDRLGPSDKGLFLNHRGETLPW